MPRPFCFKKIFVKYLYAVNILYKRGQRHRKNKMGKEMDNVFLLSNSFKILKINY